MFRLANQRGLAFAAAVVLLVGGSTAGASAPAAKPQTPLVQAASIEAFSLIRPASAYPSISPALLQSEAIEAPAQTPESIAALQDDTGRLTVPVKIGGKGPFGFMIDTGADRTVISRELAATLGLADGPAVSVHNTGGVDVERTALLGPLEVGARSVSDIQAPQLAQTDLGAAGSLGIDSLKNQRVVLDFVHHRLTVERSHRIRFDPGAIVVHARSRFGQLILVDASIGGAPVFVILDSGAQSSVGNLAMRKIVAAADPVGRAKLATYIISVTGRMTPAEASTLTEVKLGGVVFRNLPVAYADLHTFAKFGLDHEPAMLLGMDVLSRFDKVTVDFGRHEVRLHLPEAVETAQADSVVDHRW